MTKLLLTLVIVLSQQLWARCELLKFLQSVGSWEDLENGYHSQFPNSPWHSESSYTAEGELGEANKYKGQMVRFYLYTDYATRLYPEELIIDDQGRLRASRFNKDHPVKIFIHGFGNNFNCSFPQDIKDIYILNGYKVNTILVDWGGLSMDSSSLDPPTLFRNYRIAVDNAPIVGYRVGELINFLHQSRLTKLNRIHIVGFSLGAHIAGYAGEHVHRSWLERVARITGLDPAGPLFYTGEVGRPLSSNDANFVDFIHTDMGQAGTTRSDGHANFFVNGGVPGQPGCVATVLRSGFFDKIPLALSGSCSHDTAPIYYAQSILHTDPFIQARKCFAYMAYEVGMCFFRSSAILGEFCSTGIEGDFYVDLVPMRFPQHLKC